MKNQKTWVAVILLGTVAVNAGAYLMIRSRRAAQPEPAPIATRPTVPTPSVTPPPAAPPASEDANAGLARALRASGLAALRTASRLVLGLGGVATLGVTVCAQPAHGSATTHVAFATTGFVLLAIWPATTARASAGPVPLMLRWPYAFAGSALSIALLAWVGATRGSGPLGLAERLLTADQALWPLLVVLALRRSARSRGRAARIAP